MVVASRLWIPLYHIVFPVSQTHIFCKAFSVKPGTGGPENELLSFYSKRTCQYHKVSDSVYVPDVELSLGDYIKGRQLYCSERHKTPCITCENMHHVAQVVHTTGYCSLPHAFKVVSAGVKYMAEKARRLLLKCHQFQFALAIHTKATYSQS